MVTVNHLEESELSGPDMSPSPSGGGQEQEMRRPHVDDEQTYHPVFCLTEVPREYWDEFEYWEGYTPWLEVVSNSPDKAFDEIMAQIQDEGPSPTPFLGCTIEEIYDFFKAHLRPPDDSVALEHFTSFTFTVIDAECVLSHPQQCIICCDAPDFGEADDEIKLKQLRLPLQEWSHTVGGLELLRRTPSEIESQAPMVIATMPPPELVPIPDKPGLYRIATPAESRVARKRAIRVVEEADIVS